MDAFVQMKKKKNEQALAMADNSRQNNLRK